MGVDLGWLVAETRRQKLSTRRVHRELTRLADEQAAVIARLDIEPGDPLNERQVCDFLHRARGTTRQGVVITVSQAPGPQTKEPPDGEDV